ncbi:MAG: coproporphyrinogen dehydrogenase HemZ [Roseburia sp.]|nr:coproporphyrinogen dehydrogenase HemZ [Roseburia sp.]MCM1242056.1 coproporphyrinogen dehydrogenase HemZ [Roseburia sp.]
MMIIKSNKAQYEYDIHSLIKAFYPQEEVRILTPESVVKDKSILKLSPAMEIIFEEEKVELRVFAQNNVFLWQPSEEEKGEYKNAFKRFLYRCLQKETGLSLPWGNLTGIRPTKIAMTMLEEGRDETEIEDFLQTKHLVSKEKAALGIDIARRENEILSRLHYTDGYSLYIGIPFCPTTCLYCSFTSFPISAWRERTAEYLGALEKEIDFTASVYGDKILDTVYIGGGTPTSLSAEELERLLSKVRASFDFSTVQEFTVEAGRADSISEEKLRVLKKYGVTRISVNPQTMKQETLQFIGRRHTVEQVRKAFYLARETGFDNINMDIILGLPGEGEDDVRATIEAIERLAPDALTVHSLAIKRASKLAQWIVENGISALHNTERTMKIAQEGAARMRMQPYYLYRQKNMSGNFENVGYAREGKYGIYNILIMEEKQTIVALGAGTVTKRVYGDGLIRRCDTVKDVEQYIERIGEMIERKRRLL